MNQNLENVESFIVDLNALGIEPLLKGEFLMLEYNFEKDLQKSVSKLIDHYVGFWKSIAIETNHSRNPNVARYKIPLKFITREDITDEQLFAIVDNISKRIGMIPD